MEPRDVGLLRPHGKLRPVRLRLKRLIHTVGDTYGDATHVRYNNLALSVSASQRRKTELGACQRPTVILFKKHHVVTSAVPMVVVHTLSHSGAVSGAVGSAVGPHAFHGGLTIATDAA
ncbi:hypothetical protein Vafri_1621 [Volvox africanus]|nr:hypothetical protein Vafri_1621 [Volvox africanus]